ncbi:DUF2399 domain-containing protein [Streptomyces sp. NBC_01136]|uniref:DUF2399 domain-containing protein n=1 Tax=unclassified Streptomyces TaxID=2593676 RepID=UPI00324DD37D|nr:DUF2399 domain-containing protein [Streptomyces sp. NBC_01136]
MRIATALLRRVPWRPWRYAAAAALTAPAPLEGTPAPSPWDPELAGALPDLEIRAEEEAVLQTLLKDLSHPESPLTVSGAP